MTDHRPIRKLKALIGMLSAMTSPERYWLYKMVENLVLYDRAIAHSSPSLDVNEFDAEQAKLIEEWYEIQMDMKKRFNGATIVSLNERVIPVYRVYRSRFATEEGE